MSFIVREQNLSVLGQNGNFYRGRPDVDTQRILRFLIHNYVTPHITIYVFLLIKCVYYETTCNIIRHYVKNDN